MTILNGVEAIKLLRTEFCETTTLIQAVHEEYYIANCLVEEMSELTQEVCKVLRGRINEDSLAKEFAHVLMMMLTFSETAGIDFHDVVKEIESKTLEIALEEILP